MVPGDSFREMALLVDNVRRSAGAATISPCVLFELDRSGLKRWLALHPALAIEFFNKMVQVQSSRLRRTSKEVGLLFNLSHLLVDSPASLTELLHQALDHFIWYLEGTWYASAHLINGNDQAEKLL